MNNSNRKFKFVHHITSMSIALICVLFISVSYQICKAPILKFADNSVYHKVVSLDNGWYTLNNGEIVPFNSFGNEIGNRQITLCHDLSFYSKEYNTLGIYNHYSAIIVSMDDEVIYTYGSKEDLDNNVFLGDYYSIIELPDNVEDYKTIRVTFISNETQTIYAFDNANAATLARKVLSDNMTTYILIIFSIIAVVLICGLSINKKTKTRITSAHNWLAVLTVLITCWAVTISQLLETIGCPAGTLNLLTYEFYMLIPIPLLWYLYYMCNCHKRGTYLLTALVLAVFIALNVLHFAHTVSFTQTILCMHVMLALTVAFNVLKIFTEFFTDNSLANRFNMMSILLLAATGIAQFVEFYTKTEQSSFSTINIGFITFITMQCISLMFQLNEQLREDEVAVQKQIEVMNNKLRQRNELLYKSFGQFLPDSKINEMIQTNQQAKLGGDKEVITVMVTDLRGFSQIVENSEANQLIEMLNYYFSEMVRIIQKWEGTIIEYMGDGILAVFGAPAPLEDHADNAVCAAVEMQNYMRYINAWNKQHRLPKVEMGIGINSGETFVGYIGSPDRMDFNIIGMTVNLASRIETYSTGGQILISENTHKLLNMKVEIADEQSVLPKGSREPVKFYSVGDVGEPYNIKMFKHDKEPQPLTKTIPISFRIIDGKHVSAELLQGEAIAASETNLVVRSHAEVNKYDNVDIDCEGVLLGKIIDINDDLISIRFTSTPSGFKGFH